jgi:flagellar protein FliO/FliZ
MIALRAAASAARLLARLPQRAVAAAPMLGFAGAALAQSAPAPDSPVAGSLLQTTLGLVLVLALIAGAAWLAKRFAPGAMRGSMPLTVVAAQSVGQRERVVVIEVGEQWLVLGVAPGQVSALATLPRGEVPKAAPAAAPFADALQRALRRDR